MTVAWGVVDDASIAEAAELIGVPLRRDRMQWVEQATRDAIRHFAWGIGDNNPLWVDRDYAAGTRWGSLLAPPCFLYAVDYTVVAPKLPGVQWIYAGTEWTWYDVIRVDDRFAVTASLASQAEKSGRSFKRWLMQTGTVEYRTGDGKLVATAVGHCARTPRSAKGGEAGDGGASAPYRYSPDEALAIEEQVLAERRRGGAVLNWEDVSVGDQLPPVVKGPLSIVDIVAWYAATQGAQPYGGVHGDALRYRARHADYHVNQETGVKDSAGRGHLEAQTGRDVGMGGVYDVGPQRISWAGHMLSNWLGDDGVLHRLDIEIRRPNLVGDTTWWNATVSHVWQESEVSLAAIDLTATNQVGVRTAWGQAVVILPSAKYGPVQLPLRQRFVVPGSDDT